MNKHKLIRRLGVDSSEFFDDTADTKKEKKRIRKERKKYGGCSSDEVYNLDITMAMWLYEHLHVYKEYGGKIVNLESRISLFEVPVLHGKKKSSEELYNAYKESGECMYNTDIEEKTLGECIDLMLEYLKKYITKTDADMNLESYAVNEVKKNECLKCALKILSETAPALWV